MNYKKITIDGKTAYRCLGEGKGTCAGCEAKGLWSYSWMVFLYKPTPVDDAPCYCIDCIREVLE